MRTSATVGLLSVAIFACSGAVEAPPAPAGGAVSAVEMLALSVTVEGDGRVRSEPEGIACPGACSATFPRGTRVRLVSEANVGSHVDHWGGACDGAASACEVDVNGAASVVAGYAAHDAKWDPSVGEADCRDAWGAGGEKLSPCDKTPNDYVVVHKSQRNLALCKEGRLMRNFRVGLGFTPAGDKIKQGDGKTPEGVFFIPRVLPDSDYHKAFLLSYPSRDDAARAASEGLVSRAEADGILSAHANCTEPSQSTNLGGAVEIHGQGGKAGQDGSTDWTAGCVALQNEQVDALWSVLATGDTIVVLP